MNFAFSEEQEELRNTVRQFLEDKSPETEVRRLMETDRRLRPRGVDADGRAARPAGPGHPRGVRRVRASRYVELIVVLEEMGRALLCAPYFSTVVLAANTLLHVG